MKFSTFFVRGGNARVRTPEAVTKLINLCPSMTVEWGKWVLTINITIEVCRQSFIYSLQVRHIK